MRRKNTQRPNNRGPQNRRWLILPILVLTWFFEVSPLWAETDRYTDGYSEMLIYWNARRIQLIKDNYESAKEQLIEMHKTMLNRGYKNAFPFSISILKEAKKEIENKRFERATQLSEDARLLSPELPFPYYYLAYSQYKSNALKIGSSISLAIQGLTIQLRNVDTAVKIVGNFIIVCLIAWLLTGFCFLVIEFIKYQSLILHDIHHKFKSTPTWLLTAIIVLLVVLPSVGLNFVLSLIFLGILVFPYQNVKERSYLFIFFFSFFFLPFLFGIIGGALNYDKSRYALLYKLNYGIYNLADKDQLKQFIKQEPDNEAYRFLLAIIEKRDGNLSEAAVIYGALDKMKSDPATLNNLGNIYYLQRDFTKAIELYNSSIEKNPAIGITHYNLSKAYLKIQQPEKGQKAMESALIRDNNLVEFVSASSENPNRAVIDLQIQRKDLFNQFFFDNGEIRHFRNALFHHLLPIGSITLFYIIIGAFNLFLFGYLLFFKHLRLSHKCKTCGGIICRECHFELKDQSMCHECNLLSTRGDNIPTPIRQKKEQEIRDYYQLNRVFLPSIIIFGLSHIFREQVFKGVFFLLLEFVCLVYLVLPNNILLDYYHALIQLNVVKYSLLPILFIFVFLWNLLGVIRLRKQEIKLG